LGKEGEGKCLGVRQNPQAKAVGLLKSADYTDSIRQTSITPAFRLGFFNGNAGSCPDFSRDDRYIGITFAPWKKVLKTGNS
jgi:hypothetical protein